MKIEPQHTERLWTLLIPTCCLVKRMRKRCWTAVRYVCWQRNRLGQRMEMGAAVKKSVLLVGAIMSGGKAWLWTLAWSSPLPAKSLLFLCPAPAAAFLPKGGHPSGWNLGDKECQLHTQCVPLLVTACLLLLSLWCFSLLLCKLRTMPGSLRHEASEKALAPTAPHGHGYHQRTRVQM